MRQQQCGETKAAAKRRAPNGPTADAPARLPCPGVPKIDAVIGPRGPARSGQRSPRVGHRVQRGGLGGEHHAATRRDEAPARFRTDLNSAGERGQPNQPHGRSRRPPASNPKATADMNDEHAIRRHSASIAAASASVGGLGWHRNQTRQAPRRQSGDPPRVAVVVAIAESTRSAAARGKPVPPCFGDRLHGGVEFQKGNCLSPLTVAETRPRLTQRRRRVPNPDG